MDTTETTTSRATVHVENVGGIVETDVELGPGVNVLTGRNATNRTSFLRALMAAMGSDDVSVRGDAEEGRVSVAIGEDEYTRRLHRGDGVAPAGDPYLEDASVADLFAFLLESNEARRAVSTDGDLRDVLMRPVDTDAVEAEVRRLEAEKREIDAALAERGDLEERLVDLESERRRLDDRVDALCDEHAEVAAAIDAEDADLAESREEKAALDEKLDELQSLQSDRETVRHRLETTRETAERLEAERDALDERLEDVPEADGDDLGTVEDEIDDLRERKRDVEAAINQLQGIIQFNRGMLDAEDGGGIRALTDAGTDGSASVAAGLLPDGETLSCWTCGTETERSQVRATVDRLQAHHRELVSTRRSIAADLEAAIERRDDRRAIRERRESIRTERNRLEEELVQSRSAIERFGARTDELDGAIDRVAAEVDALREEDLAAVVDLHARANELEFERRRVANERDRIAERRESTAERLAELESLAERRETVRADLDAARTRIDRLEADVVESFNDHMGTVLEVLSYVNVDRLWLERTADDDGRGGTLRLNVVRTTDEGTAYRDVVEHLSESEREVTGLVFALAGYLAHEVYEQVPFVLLDSLEAIDSPRIGALVEHFAGVAPYLVVALLPEDAAAVDERHRRIESL